VQHVGYRKQLALVKIVVLHSILTKAKLPVVVAFIAAVSVKGNGKLVASCHQNQIGRNLLHLLDGYSPQNGKPTLVQQREGRKGIDD
jgi:hypothetical protein